MKIIKDVYMHWGDVKVQKWIDKIKGHEWVRVVEGEV